MSATTAPSMNGHTTAPRFTPEQLDGTADHVGSVPPAKPKKPRKKAAKAKREAKDDRDLATIIAWWQEQTVYLDSLAEAVCQLEHAAKKKGTATAALFGSARLGELEDSLTAAACEMTNNGPKRPVTLSMPNALADMIGWK